MRYQLLPLFGPFAIHSYGLFITIGLFAFLWLTPKDKRFKNLNVSDHFFSIVAVGIGATLLGGRLLYIISEPVHAFHYTDLFNFWEGGLSILGGIIGIAVIVPLYLRHLSIPIIPFFDLVTTHIGLMQGIARIGCFFAGCCYGKPCSSFWAVYYTDPLSIAPQNVWIHPTQLYSAGLSFGIFFLMYFIFQHYYKKPGQLLSLYLVFTTSERFIVDFWRADRVMTVGQLLSFNQYIALALGLVSILFFMYCTVYHKKQGFQAT